MAGSGVDRSWADSSVSVVAVLPGGGPPGWSWRAWRGSGLLWPLRRALSLTCPLRSPAPAWPTRWP